MMALLGIRLYTLPHQIEMHTQQLPAQAVAGNMKQPSKRRSAPGAASRGDETASRHRRAPL